MRIDCSVVYALHPAYIYGESYVAYYFKPECINILKSNCVKDNLYIYILIFNTHFRRVYITYPPLIFTLYRNTARRD